MLILSPPMDVVSARMLFLDLLQNLVFNFHWINLWTASQTGFYETRIAYYSWRGYEGYSYSRIPSYWRIIKEEHKGSPFWLCQGMGSTDWTTSAHHGAKKWYPCVYFNALYCFWSSSAIALWSECQNLSVYSSSTEMMFLIWTMFFSYGSLRNFFFSQSCTRVSSSWTVHSCIWSPISKWRLSFFVWFGGNAAFVPFPVFLSYVVDFVCVLWSSLFFIICLVFSTP